MEKFLAALPRLLHDEELMAQGHQQELGSSLGWGYLYYGLARAMRPEVVVVIGSWRGFVPLMFGLACEDNGFGVVWFIDPSLVDDFWKSPEGVFEAWGVRCVRHICMTTQQFVRSEDYGKVHHVGILFIDGDHSAEGVRFDHEAFAPRMIVGGVTLFHDSVNVGTQLGSDRPCGVFEYLNDLRARGHEFHEFTQWPGLALHREGGR